MVGQFVYLRIIFRRNTLGIRFNEVVSQFVYLRIIFRRNTLSRSFEWSLSGAETNSAGAIESGHELALLPAVKNGYNENYIDNDLFDSSYADASTCYHSSLSYSSATA